MLLVGFVNNNSDGTNIALMRTIAGGLAFGERSSLEDLLHFFLVRPAYSTPCVSSSDRGGKSCFIVPTLCSTLALVVLAPLLRL